MYFHFRKSSSGGPLWKSGAMWTHCIN